MIQQKVIDALVLPISKYWRIISCVIAISLSLVALFIFPGLKYHIFWLMMVCVLLSVIIPGLFIRIKIDLIANKGRISKREKFAIKIYALLLFLQSGCRTHDNGKHQAMPRNF